MKSTKTPSTPTKDGPMEPEKLLRVSEAATRYDLHEETLREWARKGVVPHVRVGPPPGQIRFRPSDLERPGVISPEDRER